VVSFEDIFQEAGDLKIEADDRILVVERSSEDWWVTAL
jgi:hypothetical protein